MKLNKITPNLMVADVRRSVVFYRDVCGFSTTMALRDDLKTIDAALVDGAGYIFVIMIRDGVELMVQEEGNLRSELPGSQRARPTGLSATYYITVEEVDALHDSIKSKAPEAVTMAPKTSWYGMREFCIEDPDRHMLMFAEQQQAQA